MTDRLVKAAGLIAAILRPLRKIRSQRDLEDDELAADSIASGKQAICDLRPQEQVEIKGRIEALTMSPGDEAPKLVARLRDGTGSIQLVWIGRRHIAGVNAGVVMVVAGTTATYRDKLAIYNPSYELVIDD